MLIQKLHPGIRLGQQPVLAGSGNPLFSRQGHWDGGSTLHCVAMALALIGRIDDPVRLPYRTSGNERTVWDHAWPHYLHGLTFSELASFVWELNLGVRPAAFLGQANGVLRFGARELNSYRPVIVGWRQRQPVASHAALVVGVEGRLSGRAFEPHALLLLDPAGNAPGLAGFNARIDVRSRGRPCYLSTDVAHHIRFEGALSLRPAATASADA
ncbi:hypothetical protein DPV79_21395 [Burkholderia reimsis]|uniref:Peptidase C39-like domain-containing protein n=1 Tax=Burkholderia reimsis TaxID=2234132 RepID=A0A365QSH3_9BURK|nr:hypothetical protein [Burkholderia reimsis]RBB37552.1 hypothetical protein DPV79_21395 [Burkholderia reimsis]